MRGAHPLDLTGQWFGRLIAIRPTDRRSGRGVVWECRCDCGNTKSCGCLLRRKRPVGAGND